MRWVLTYGLIMLTWCATGQRERLHEFMDSNYVHQPIYDQAHGGSGEEVDPENLDFKKLNALVVEAINKRRTGKGRSALEQDTLLDALAYYYATKASPIIFERRFMARKNFGRDLVKLKLQQELNQGLLRGIFVKEYAMQYDQRGRSFFRYGEDKELVYGNPRDMRDSTWVPIVIEDDTYGSLADKILTLLMRAPNKRELMYKYHTHAAVCTFMDERTTHGKKIPQVKVALVLGAPRLANPRVQLVSQSD